MILYNVSTELVVPHSYCLMFLNAVVHLVFFSLSTNSVKRPKRTMDYLFHHHMYTCGVKWLVGASALDTEIHKQVVEVQKC